MRTFMALDELAKQYPGQIKLLIPETIVCSYDPAINLLYTDDQGILRSRLIKPDDVFYLGKEFY